MFDPEREICSGVFSFLENPYQKSSPETPGVELCLQRGTGETSALQPTLGAVTSSVPGFQLFHPDACTFKMYFCEEHLWPQQVQKEKDNPFRVSHGKHY